MKFILILTIMTANLESVSVATAEFDNAYRCQQASKAWVMSAGKATPAVSAICVNSGAGEDDPILTSETETED